MFFKGPFWGAYFWRRLSTEGNLRFKIDWASLINRRKFTIFALFYFVFEGNFQVQAPRGAYIWRGDLTEDFLRYEFGGLIIYGTFLWYPNVPVKTRVIQCPIKLEISAWHNFHTKIKIKSKTKWASRKPLKKKEHWSMWGIANIIISFRWWTEAGIGNLNCN